MCTIIASLALNEAQVYVDRGVENNLEWRANIFVLTIKPLVINACRKL